MKKIAAIILILFIASESFAQTKQVKISAKNEMLAGRLNQTLEIPFSQLKSAGLAGTNNLHIKTDAGRELICQLVESPDGDRKIIFQSDFGPGEEKIFYAYSGEPNFYPTSAYKTYGRSVRERFDDFAWENDRIAMRAYGPALRTANPGSLTSSAIDIWCKKTDKLVINEWYMKDHYHSDWGEGADLYQSGTSRGVGGDGIWADGKLWTAANYTKSKVLSLGPVRIYFELEHDPFPANNLTVKESRYVSLDAGQNLNHFVIRYDSDLPKGSFAAAGIQKTNFTTEEIRKGLDPNNIYQSKERKPGKILRKDVNEKAGWLTTEQDLSEGKLFSAIIVNPSDFEKAVVDTDNELIITKPNGKEFSYRAGFAWSESGQFESYEDWKSYIDQFAKEILSPIKLRIGNSN